MQYLVVGVFYRSMRGEVAPTASAACALADRFHDEHATRLGILDEDLRLWSVDGLKAWLGDNPDA